MTVKASTVCYLVATILFALGAAAVGKELPVTELGFVFTGAGLTVGSVGN